MPKPSELYLGVLDFFAVILPGAIAAAILQQAWGSAVLGTVVTLPKSETAQWAAFLVTAYLLGHLIFLVGSYVDPVYDKLRKRLNATRHRDGWLRHTAIPESLEKNQQAYVRATAIRNSLLAPEDQPAVNSFQWARAVLISKNPAAAADVQRLEADSKFFRSFLVVSIFTGIACFEQAHHIEAAVAFLLVIPCFARYCERRLKSTTQAYIHILTMHGLGELARKSKERGAATAAPGPSLRP
ncbi:MAG: hypothetical protein NTZ56_12065 [Acidobacteria bacterium]|nr:hypothetical protein [Acidobacteriota bacterium]